MSHSSGVPIAAAAEVAVPTATATATAADLFRAADEHWQRQQAEADLRWNQTVSNMAQRWMEQLLIPRMTAALRIGRWSIELVDAKAPNVNPALVAAAPDVVAVVAVVGPVIPGPSVLPPATNVVEVPDDQLAQPMVVDRLALFMPQIVAALPARWRAVMRDPHRLTLMCLPVVGNVIFCRYVDLATPQLVACVVEKIQHLGSPATATASKPETRVSITWPWGEPNVMLFDHATGIAEPQLPGQPQQQQLAPRASSASSASSAPTASSGCDSSGSIKTYRILMCGAVRKHQYRLPAFFQQLVLELEQRHKHLAAHADPASWLAALKANLVQRGIVANDLDGTPYAGTISDVRLDGKATDCSHVFVRIRFAGWSSAHAEWMRIDSPKILAMLPVRSTGLGPFFLHFVEIGSVSRALVENSVYPITHLRAVTPGCYAFSCAGFENWKLDKCTFRVSNARLTAFPSDKAVPVLFDMHSRVLHVLFHYPELYEFNC